MKKSIVLIIILILTISKFLYSQGNWQVVNSFPQNQSVFTIKALDSNTCLIGTLGKILLTTNCGINWQEINTVAGYAVKDIEFLNENTGYAACKNYLFKTTNKGINWVSQNLNYSVNRIQIITKDTIFISSNSGTILRTYNSGIDWQSIQMPFTFDLGEFSFASLNYGYVLSNDIGGFPTASSNIYKTTDSGLNWSYSNFNYSSVSICLMYIFFKDSLTGLVGSRGIVNQYPYYSLGNIYRTTNGGVNWISTLSCLGVRCEPKGLKFFNKNTGFTLLNNSFISTTNSGSNWSTFFTFNDTIFLSFFDFSNFRNGYVYSSIGLLKSTNSGFVGINNELLAIPSSFSLSQNYPNPFNPTTSIKYQVASIKHIKLVVYNILGKEIATLVNEKQSPGTYEVTWDASAFPSGVYFCQLSIDNEQFATKKMILLK